MIDQDPNRPDMPILGLQIGTVVERDDPEGLGQVRIRIEGLIEPKSAWALPLGTLGGGGPQRGSHFVPPVGAEVGVLFKNGDPDQPFYFCGNLGREEHLAESGTGHPDAQVIESETHLIVMDTRPDTRRLLMRDKRSGDQIELDGVNRIITINATNGIQLNTAGVISLNGLLVQVNDVAAGDGQL